MIGTDTIFVPDTLPSSGEGLMGMVYDEKASAWRLDLPCRINGRPTHLKDTIYGPKRKTQAKAMQRWLELHEQAKKPESSLKFGDDCDKYINDNPQLQQGIISIIEHLKSGLGTVKRGNFKVEFTAWIDKEKKRTVRNTERTLSKSTIQAYMRYAKLIVRANGYGDTFDGVTIGRRVIRRRAIEMWEMIKLEEAIQEFYPWFFPAFDFARTNPIRPEDQFSLTVEKHLRDGRIIYEPIKTYAKTELCAYPIIWEHQKPWFDSRVSGLIFCRPDGSSMMHHRYYDFIWGKILSKAGVSGIQFYDLRHHAVAWMRSHGVEDWRIVKSAGWASTQMLVEYDPDNRHLIDEYDKGLNPVVKCSTVSSTQDQK